MTAAKRRAAKGKGGKGMVKNRPAGRRIMRTWAPAADLRAVRIV